MGSAPSILYVADTNNHRIRAINLTSRMVSTIAGWSMGWNDGVGTVARFNLPSACAVKDDNSVMYVADSANSAIRVIDLSTKNVTTIIGAGCRSSGTTCPGLTAGCCGFAVRDNSGGNSLCSGGTGTMSAYAPYCYKPGMGSSATWSSGAASFSDPQSLAFTTASPCNSTAGCLWVSDKTTGTLSIVNLTSNVMRLSQCFFASTPCSSCSPSGGCFVYTDSLDSVKGVSVGTGNSVFVASPSRFGILACTLANLSSLASCSYIVGQDHGWLYQRGYDSYYNPLYDSLGSWGDEQSGQPLNAGIIYPLSLSFDASLSPPSLFVGDSSVVRQVSFMSSMAVDVITVAGGRFKVTGPWKSPAPNNIYTPAQDFVNGVGTMSAFKTPNSVVAVHATRILYIADSGSNAIRAMTY